MPKIFLVSYDLSYIKGYAFSNTCLLLQPNCIILAISPANQDLATSDAIKISREVDPKGMILVKVVHALDNRHYFYSES